MVAVWPVDFKNEDSQRTGKRLDCTQNAGHMFAGILPDSPPFAHAPGVSSADGP
jgi:hypothetical protein